MPANHYRRRSLWRRLALATLAGASPFALPALAADRAPTPEGAEALRGLAAKFLPFAQTGSPLVTVTQEAADYVISVDLGALKALFGEAGVTYDPATLAYKAVEQDDGNWRLALDGLPHIAFHSRETSGALDLANFRSTALINPAIAWLLDGSAGADKGALRIETPKFDQGVDFGAVQENVTTTVGGDNSVSTTVKEEISDISFKAVGVGAQEAPVNVSGRLDKALIALGVDGFKSRKAFDLWTLLASHPERADLAAHETELKGLMKELVAPGLKLAEGIEAQKTVVASSIGAITLADARYEVGAANAGPESSISINVSADGLSLPVALLPPGANDLTPSKVGVTATLKGLDITAAANEWISDLTLQGDGPVISDHDLDKVEAALLGAGPIRIEIAPSHILAPAIDGDFTGVIRFDHGKPAGSFTAHMRDFDKTMAAVKRLGPDVAVKAMPPLALAKGLANSEADGSLSWLVEIDADRSIKVNGIPFGKAPD